MFYSCWNNVLSKTHQLPFTLLEKLFKCYLSWSQGSVKSKPCRFFRRCPFSPLPAAAFLASLKLALHHFDRCGTRQTPFCLVFFYFASYDEPQHPLKSCISTVQHRVKF